MKFRCMKFSHSKFNRPKVMFLKFLCCYFMCRKLTVHVFTVVFVGVTTFAGVQETDVVYCPLPLYHSVGGMIRCWATFQQLSLEAEKRI